MMKKTIQDYKQLEIKYNITFLNLENNFPKNVNTKIKVKCNKCNFGEGGEWESYYSYFIMKHKCPKCVGKYRKKIIDYIDVASKANIILFDLKNNFPKNTQIPVKAQCIKCKYIWQISFDSIQKTRGCPNCAGNVKKTIEDYENLLKNKNIIMPDINNNLPKNSQTKTKAICEKCNHEWETSYNRISNGAKCSNCKKIKKYEKYIKLSNEKNLIFLDFTEPPKNTQIPIKALCNKCKEEWFPNYNGLKNGKSCPNCCGFNGRGESLTRYIMENIFKEKFVKIKPYWLINKKTGCRLELDGYCENLNLAFEYQGAQHFKIIKKFKNNELGLKQQQERDLIKINKCNQHNVNLIIINEFKYLTYKHIYAEMKLALSEFKINDKILSSVIISAIKLI